MQEQQVDCVSIKECPSRDAGSMSECVLEVYHPERQAHLKVASRGTSSVGLPKMFIIKPCLPVDSTLNRERNIFKNPMCSCDSI